MEYNFYLSDQPKQPINEEDLIKMLKKFKERAAHIAGQDR